MGINAKQYQNEEDAREYLERKLWPNGPVCPHEGCGAVNDATKLVLQTEGKRNGKTVQFATHARTGTYRCRKCEKQFSITVGTIFEDSHIPLHKWLMAIHLMCSSKKGISALQLMRELELGSYRSAWFMCHRVRWAMGKEPVKGLLDGIVEIDETYIGGKIRAGAYATKPGERPKDRPSPVANKAAVVSVLQRGGDVVSTHVQKVTSENLKTVIKQTVAPDAHLMTDTSTVLKSAGMGHRHDMVNHSRDEYSRHENGLCITTNSVESYFAIVKRGNYGVFHHWDVKYTGQYLKEFDFRYNARKVSDNLRTDLAIQATQGKRLMLKNPINQSNQD
jgi:hypothetical protein